MKIIKPPIFGKITYLVPDKNETNGIDIIRINTLGSKILNARLPDLKLSPKTESMFSEKIKSSKLKYCLPTQNREYLIFVFLVSDACAVMD